MARNYYQVLGIDPEASQDEIKQAYRELAKSEHPDLTDKPNATEAFGEINQAYNVLKDPKKRRRYDHKLSKQGSKQSKKGSDKSRDKKEQSSNDFDPRVYTRGSREADYIWAEDTTRVATPNPNGSVFENSIGKVVFAYSIAIIPVFVMYWLYILAVFPGGLTFDQLGVPWWMAPIQIGLVLLASIMAAEAILDTERKVTDSIFDGWDVLSSMVSRFIPRKAD